MRLIAMLMLVLLAAGCGTRPESLIGLDRSEVVWRLGTPQEEAQRVVAPRDRPIFGPKPAGLRSGERYTMMFYANIGGDMWFVFLASPALYQRMYHVMPAGDADRVVDVQPYPKNAVF